MQQVTTGIGFFKRSYVCHLFNYQNLCVSKMPTNFYELPRYPQTHLFFFLRSRNKTRKTLKMFLQSVLLLSLAIGGFPRFFQRVIKWRNWKKKPHYLFFCVFRWAANQFPSFLANFIYLFLPFFLRDGFKPGLWGHRTYMSTLVAPLVYHPFLLQYSENLFINRITFRTVFLFTFMRRSNLFFNLYVDFLRYFNWPLNRYTILYYVDWLRYTLYHNIGSLT